MFYIMADLTIFIKNYLIYITLLTINNCYEKDYHLIGACLDAGSRILQQGEAHVRDKGRQVPL